MVTFSFLPESLSPTLKRESPNLSTSLYVRMRKGVSEGRVTYLELPLLHASPVVGHACDDAGSASFLVSFDELFDSNFVYIDSLNGVSEVGRIFYLEEFVLATPVTILGPLAQKHVAPMLRLHVVHLLDDLIRHFTGFEDEIGESGLSGVGDSLVVDHVLNGQLFEELSGSLLLWGRLKVGLLELVLLGLQHFVFLRLSRFLFRLSH